MTHIAKGQSDRPLAGRAAHSTAVMLLAITLLAALALAPPIASAATSRPYQTSIASSLPLNQPNAIAVDQSNGDIYAADGGDQKVYRFDSSGVPKNFTAGPDAGTNSLTSASGLPTGMSAGPHALAIDNSGGPLNGTLYVLTGSGNKINSSEYPSIKAFSASGVPLGSVVLPEPVGSPNAACGLAVDQSNGSIYTASRTLSVIWRFAPSSPSGAPDASDYSITGISADGRGCALAADSGHVYATTGGLNSVSDARSYSATDFSAGYPSVGGTLVESDVNALAVDPGTGDLYADKGYRVDVFNSSGESLYHFGHAADFGPNSAAIAVRRAASGPATKAYLADVVQGEIDVYGSPAPALAYTHPELADFGPDGSGSSSFTKGGNLGALAFDPTDRSLFAVDGGVPGVYGFDASGPPAFAPLAGFAPLGTAAPGLAGAVAVDATSLASAGNVYLASASTGLLYGFDSSGAPLSGFPVDPAASPGAPDGSPKNLCGAAVDSAGNVWVANSSTAKVLKYSSAGAYLGSVDTSAQGHPCQLAFNSAGDLYVQTSTPQGLQAPLVAVWKYTAASVYATASLIARGQGSKMSLAVDPANDHLYLADVGSSSNNDQVGWVDEYDSAGNFIDEFLTGTGSTSAPRGIALDGANQYLYLGDALKGQVRVFGPGVLLPELSTAPPAPLANSTATLKGTVNDQAVALSDCHFQYVTLAAFRVSGFTDLSSGGTQTCSPAAGSIPLDLNDHPVSAAIGGLTRNTEYRFRLVASNASGQVSSDPRAFTSTGPPEVETTGAPVRSATTAQLGGRVNPRGAAATFHFEYGDQGPCDSSPCNSTPDLAAGSGTEIELVAERLANLSPDTTYHYRLVADNGNSDGPAVAQEMTFHTRANDDPLSHGDLPGPPDSDRAYEQISIGDSSGNPAVNAWGFSANGDRAVYQLGGGGPGIDYQAMILSERHANPDGSGRWVSRQITPPATQVPGNVWSGAPLLAAGDLSTLLATNTSSIKTDVRDLWSLSPDQSPTRIFAFSPTRSSSADGLSADGSLAVAVLRGDGLDPAYPAAASHPNLYDIDLDPPTLLSLLPGSQPGCVQGSSAFLDLAPAASHWIAADGSYVFFPSRDSSCAGETQLYVRDVAAHTTTEISGPPVSGEKCGAAFLRGTSDAAFFVTNSRLVTADTDPHGCGTAQGDGDVYRYDIATGTLKCVTCLLAGLDTNVDWATDAPTQKVAVSEDGSRVYFASSVHLVAGAPASGEAIYRVDVATGDLAYVAPIGQFDYAGQSADFGNALSFDGSAFVFRSADTALNPLGAGTDNGGAAQYYRYDDRDRSLTCVSCPPDGSRAIGPVPAAIIPRDEPNLSFTALSDDGKTLAFAAPSSLVGADQNTPAPGVDPAAGTDVYEWRDGRTLLVTDGLTQWPVAGAGVEELPRPNGVSPDGRDLYFIAAAQYTPDAIDSLPRLYDARIGGGFTFPTQPPPCPLEVCQGTPKGAPDDPSPASSSYRGAGNVKPAPATKRCRKGQRKVRRKDRTLCVAKKHSKRHAKRTHRRAHR